MKVEIPKNTYIQKIEINDSNVDIHFQPKKKVGLMFISLNPTYWPYLAQVLKDCRAQFLTHHQVEYFVWTDYNEESKKRQFTHFETLWEKWNGGAELFNEYASLVHLHRLFYPQAIQQATDFLAQHNLFFKSEGIFKNWMESNVPVTKESVRHIVEAAFIILRAFHADMDATLQGVTISETEGIEWPAPTLMRYHLFLNQKEALQKMDYLFYLDADMRVVQKISDEILGEGLTAAPHPGYAIAAKFIPPYEPNPDSTAYIHRLGFLAEENGKKRFKPFYAAGGFQGGVTKEFIKAMETMRANIDLDFDKNYVAIWNDESHWNKYLWNYKKHITFLDVSYVHPDSLIKEYYIPLWGQEYQPKIITLTKPFSLSVQGGKELQELTQLPK